MVINAWVLIIREMDAHNAEFLFWNWRSIFTPAYFVVLVVAFILSLCPPLSSFSIV